MKFLSRQLLVIGFLLCLPLFWNYLQPAFFHLHDFTHVSRLAELERGWIDGQLPIRWSQNLGYGYGMPQFSFYAPLFYYNALVFVFLGFSYLWAIKLTVIFQALLSFWGLYKLGERLWDKWTGFLIGIAGIYIPYRLVDMYVRGAFGELSGITFFILTLYAAVVWSKKPTYRRAILVALSGAGILLSHNLMALISAPFIVFWLLFWSIKEKVLRSHVLQVIFIGALTIGLSAWYAVPAFLEKGYTQADKLTTGFSNYNHHFLYIRQLWNSPWDYGGSIWGIEDDISFELGKVQVIIAVIIIGLYTAALLRRKKTQSFDLLLMMGALLGISLFLTILKSKFIWDTIPLLSYVQFPWRYLSLAIVFIPLFIGLLRQFIPKKLWPAVAGSLALIIIMSQAQYARPEAFLDNNAALYYSDPSRISSDMSGIIPDFLPITAVPEELPVLTKSQERFMFSHTTTYRAEVDRSHEFLLLLQSPSETTLTVGIFDFPGWTMYLDGEKMPHDVTPEGLIQMNVPGKDGERIISGKFEETPLRNAANIFTVISLCFAGYMWFRPRLTKGDSNGN
jgi:hypothetical protein